MDREGLIAQYRELHDHVPTYGRGGVQHLSHLCELFMDHEVVSVLDYGCGKGDLVRELDRLGFESKGYDPAIPEFATFPEWDFDAVVSTDVFEHLDPDTFLVDLSRIAERNPRVCHFVISLRPAVFHLPNGENCHSLVKTPEWWEDMIGSVFPLYSIQSNINGRRKELHATLVRRAEDQAAEV